MRTATFAAAAALAMIGIAAPGPAEACQAATTTTTAKKMKISKVTTARLAALMEESKQKGVELHVYDVNSPKTRAKMGVIPGAKLLTFLRRRVA